MANPARLPLIRRSLRNLFSRPATRLYPTVRRPSFAGARGALRLDLARCNCCGRCSKRCPTGALRVSREASTFSLDELLCISCGACLTVCNRHSISLTEQPPAILAVTEDDPRSAGLGRHEWQVLPGSGAPATRQVAAGPESSH